jgi:glycosyltransferase involved in cell wall biosynthesis
MPQAAIPTPPDEGPIQASGLRVAFFSDSLPERNGTGGYYYDLIEQLAPHVEAVEIFQPKARDGHPILSIPMPGDPMQRLVPPNLWRIRNGCRRLQPNVVIAITPGPFGLLGLYHAKRLGITFIAAFHTDFEKLAELYWRPFSRAVVNSYLRTTNRLLCGQSKTVLINNSGLRKDVTALGACAVEVMGTPIQPSFLERPLQAPPGHVQQVCFAGRLAAEKNVAHIIEAARALPQLQFVICGDGPLRKSLEASAADLPNLRFTGWLSREALIDLLDASSLLLLPSKLETFGSVALEAMARGRPALVSANAGIHDWPLLRPGLFRLAPNESLQSALQTLLAKKAEFWQQTAHTAREAADQLNDETISQWVEVLRRHRTKT